MLVGVGNFRVRFDSRLVIKSVEENNLEELQWDSLFQLLVTLLSLIIDITIVRFARNIQAIMPIYKEPHILPNNIHEL